MQYLLNSICIVQGQVNGERIQSELGMLLLESSTSNASTLKGSRDIAASIPGAYDKLR